MKKITGIYPSYKDLIRKKTFPNNDNNDYYNDLELFNDFMEEPRNNQKNGNFNLKSLIKEKNQFDLSFFPIQKVKSLSIGSEEFTAITQIFEEEHQKEKKKQYVLDCINEEISHKFVDNLSNSINGIEKIIENKNSDSKNTKNTLETMDNSTSITEKNGKIDFCKYVNPSFIKGKIFFNFYYLLF